MGRKDARTRGLGDAGTWDAGTRGRGTRGLGDAGTWDLGTRGRGDVGTRGRGDAGLGDVGREDVINKKHPNDPLNLQFRVFVKRWSVCQQISSL